jgi:hypothetical protein
MLSAFWALSVSGEDNRLLMILAGRVQILTFGQRHDF